MNVDINGDVLATKYRPAYVRCTAIAVKSLSLAPSSFFVAMYPLEDPDPTPRVHQPTSASCAMGTWQEVTFAILKMPPLGPAQIDDASKMKLQHAHRQ